ncbi:hypothetical protein [Fibrella forsythiae]|uniref:Uncharacterized protein n=1 Tax=Fibrella forsythiae TaxID=2817061 RepID=A0ABS3JMK0_9BACT|nr:hypothetical protein [Fibrella forsythiae]MBO0951245.1 hypothetical protein [Fibrella forsythiae]
MKARNQATYLWLGLCFSLFNNQAMAQGNDDFREIGWGRYTRSIYVPVHVRKGKRWINSVTLSQMLSNDGDTRAGISAFEDKFPGRGVITLTNELLTVFDQTQDSVAGFHLFFGLDSTNKFQPVIVHTRINRLLDSIGTGADQRSDYYLADFRKAMFWQYGKRQWVVAEAPATNPYALDNQITANRAKFPYPNTQGYYFAKGALVDAWKSSGKKPLTLFFSLRDENVHVFIPYCPMASLTESTTRLKLAPNRHATQVPIATHGFSTDVDGTEQDISVVANRAANSPTQTVYGTANKAGALTRASSATSLRATNSFKLTGSIRPCPSYCGRP